MILDSSAIIAVIRREAAGHDCLEAMRLATSLRLSAATLVEAAIVVDSTRDGTLIREFDDLFRQLLILIEPVTEVQARIAREAYRTFGRGSGHPAKLNFGDCFAYALAKELDEPLLFIGQDFVHTDVRRALAGE